MASNKELKQKATELGVELGIDVTERIISAKNNVGLLELVKVLNAEKAAASPETPGTETAADETAEGTDDDSTISEPEPEAKVAKPKAIVKSADKVWRIAEGKSLTSKRGILGPGVECCAKDFSGGQETFDYFCKRDYIVKS